MASLRAENECTDAERREGQGQCTLGHPRELIGYEQAYGSNSLPASSNGGKAISPRNGAKRGVALDLLIIGLGHAGQLDGECGALRRQSTLAAGVALLRVVQSPRRWSRRQSTRSHRDCEGCDRIEEAHGRTPIFAKRQDEGADRALVGALAAGTISSLAKSNVGELESRVVEHP
jgi:hypothetical protein